jgi:hypothetical protein
VNAIKERNCIKCASKGLLLRRKGKPAKSLLKSVVVKSAKMDRFDNSEVENWSPKCSNRKPSGKESLGEVVDVPDVAKAPSQAVSTVPQASECVVHDDDVPRADETDETDVLISRRIDPIFQGTSEEDEDPFMHSQGVLCVLPPSVYSFIFGD